MSFEFTGAFGLPSVQSALETSENVFWWGRFEQEAFIGSIIDGSARDAGNTGYTDGLVGYMLGVSSKQIESIFRVLLLQELLGMRVNTLFAPN